MRHVSKLFFVSIALILPVMIFAQSGRELYAEANKINAEADKKLNAAYAELIKNIRADNEKDQAEFVVKSLRESQRAWLTYRDAQVAFVGTHANIGPSSSRALGLATYSAELTEQRIKEFEAVPNPF